MHYPPVNRPFRHRRPPLFGAAAAALLFALYGAAAPLAAATCVVDDAGREVCLDAPPERIISLSPHATEQLFAVGAGERIVGTVSHSDYPPEAEAIPRVGGYNQLDLERIVAKEPDLVVGWQSGNPSAQLERIEALGVPLYISEPRGFEDVARGLERLGRITGRAEAGAAAAADFREELADLAATYAERDPVTLFYQIWERPLMTVSDAHLIGEAIALCGGDNIFGDSERLAPRIDEESVIAADPEAIGAGGMGEERADWLDDWREYGDLTAVRRDNLFFIPPSVIQRHTPRILEGTRKLCEVLEEARQRRPDSGD